MQISVAGATPNFLTCSSAYEVATYPAKACGCELVANAEPLQLLNSPTYVCELGRNGYSVRLNIYGSNHCTPAGSPRFHSSTPTQNGLSTVQS
jgi:hypothetical protein